MTVLLRPPYTRSYPADHIPEPIPLRVSERFMRTRAMGRWHRPRSAMVMQPWGAQRTEESVHVNMWCGQGIYDAERRALRADEVPAGEPVCGTCQGRALGAGQDPIEHGPDLLFVPYPRVPARCPGSRREDLGSLLPGQGNVARCWVCGDHMRMVGGGGWHHPTYGLQTHRPGPGLVPPCPRHAWSYLIPLGGQARCRCQLPKRVEPGRVDR